MTSDDLTKLSISLLSLTSVHSELHGGCLEAFCDCASALGFQLS